METIKELFERLEGRYHYDSVEVYEGEKLHTDFCTTVGEFSGSEKVREWEIMGREEYGETILANGCISAEDIMEPDEKILVILIEQK